MKTRIRFFALASMAMAFLMLLSACLDPVNMGSDLNLNISGDINFTDVTASAFVLTNLSKTIEVTLIEVTHPSYNGDSRKFEDVPRPLTSKAVFTNASEDNYFFEISWELPGVPGVKGENPFLVELTMPLSRHVYEYFIFLTDDNEVVLVPGPIENVRERNYHRGDTEINISVIQSDPALTLIAQQIFNSQNSGWLTIRNGSNIDLSGLRIEPRTTQLASSMTPVELAYVQAWRPTLRPRNASVEELPTTGIRIRVGDYVVIHDRLVDGVDFSLELAEVSVQSEMATNFGTTNLITILNLRDDSEKPPEIPDCPCPCEDCDEDCECGDNNCIHTPPELPYSVNRIDFRVIVPFFQASSGVTAAYPSIHDYTPGLGVGQTLDYLITLSGPGSISERQATADEREVTTGTGIFYDKNLRIARVRKESNTDAWIRYTIPAVYNGGVPIFIQINF